MKTGTARATGLLTLTLVGSGWLASGCGGEGDAPRQGAAVVPTPGSTAARPIATVTTLDFDADGKIEAASDGLLVMRRLFGIDEAAASGEAVAAPDVDGNGSVDPLTDGLLVLRYISGLTGDELVTGAVDTAGCTRCDAASIETYLGSLR